MISSAHSRHGHGERFGPLTVVQRLRRQSAIVVDREGPSTRCLVDADGTGKCHRVIQA